MCLLHTPTPSALGETGQGSSVQESVYCSTSLCAADHDHDKWQALTLKGPGGGGGNPPPPPRRFASRDSFGEFFSRAASIHDFFLWSLAQLLAQFSEKSGVRFLSYATLCNRTSAQNWTIFWICVQNVWKMASCAKGWICSIIIWDCGWRSIISVCDCIPLVWNKLCKFRHKLKWSWWSGVKWGEVRRNTFSWWWGPEPCWSCCVTELMVTRPFSLDSSGNVKQNRIMWILGKVKFW